MSELDKEQTFALEEFRALRREIDGQEAILDRIMSRAVTLIAICYLLVVFERVPFTQAETNVPNEIKMLLVFAPIVIAVVSWVDYGNRYAHLKVMARYIENIEETFGFNTAGKRNAWERYLRESEAEMSVLPVLRRLRHHLNWVMIFSATVVAAALLVPVIEEQAAPQDVSAIKAPTEGASITNGADAS